MAVNLTLEPINTDNGAKPGPTSGSVYINENIASGTVVGRIRGWESTAGSFTIQVLRDVDGRYEVIGDKTNGYFLRVKSGGNTLFDFEDDAYLGIHDQITFKFLVGTQMVHQGVFDVYLNDLPEGPGNNAPTDVRIASGGTVNENASSGTSVATIAATDDGGAAGLRYSIENNSNFAIDATTGVVTVKAGATLNFEAGSTISLDVTATDTNGTGLSTVKELTFTIADVNEAATGVSYTNAQVIQAGATGQNSQVVLATAVDPDTKASFKNNLYKFADSGTTTDSSGLFHIDSATGQITTTRAVVAGDAGQKTLKVIAYDGVLSGPAIDYTFTIAGPSNQPPSNIRFQSGGTVNENAGSGAAVGTVTANDDGGTSGLRYSIANNSNFVIDAVTGAITVKNGAALNFEGTASYSIAVTATDTNGTGLSTTQNVTITLVDVNEAATGVGFNGVQSVEAGVTGANSQVVVASAVDPDTAAGFRNNSYRFADTGTTTDGSGLFQINATTGQITTTRAVLAGDAGQKTLKVQAYDGALVGPSVDYSFTVSGLANQPPSNIRFQSGGTVNENANGGAAVGTVTANDDGGTAGLRYSIANNANFVIDAVTGAITVKNGAALNFEGTASYSIAVTATDTNGTGQSTTQDVTINLADVNEAATGIGFSNPGSVQAGVTGANAQVVLASAVDPDTTAGFRNNSYRFSDTGTTTDGSGLFQINATTGQITTTRAVVAGDVGDKTLKIQAYDGALVGPTVDRVVTIAAANAPTIQIVAADAAKAEGDAGTTDFTFTVTRSSGAGESSVNWGINFGGGATANAGDFANTSGTVNFLNGETSKTITVKVLGDTVVEGNETFGVTLSGAVNGTVTVATADGTIVNDDNTPGVPVVSIAATDAAKAEGNGGTTAFTFTVTRSSSVGLSTVDWLLGGAGANPASTTDVEVSTGTVVFAAGETTKTITIQVKGDVDIEGDEGFTITLANGQNASIGTGVASGTILNDDAAPHQNRAPTDVMLTGYSVQELAATGTVIGAFSAVDPDDTVGFKYTLVDSAGGRFKIEAGQLQVDNGFLLDFEQTRSYVVKVQVADSAGATFTKDLTISLTDLATEFTLGSIGNDLFKGGDAADRLSGNLGNDTIYGGGGNDALTGGAGNDILWGGAGKDTLTGNAGKDTFVFDVFNAKTNKKTNIDKIADFSVKDDSIWLDNAVFKGLGKKGTPAKPQKMSKDMFFVGSAANDASDRIIYDKAKGILYYDEDGTGVKAAVQIATIKKGLAITEKDFFII